MESWQLPSEGYFGLEVGFDYYLSVDYGWLEKMSTIPQLRRDNYQYWEDYRIHHPSAMDWKESIPDMDSYFLQDCSKQEVDAYQGLECIARSIYDTDYFGVT